MFCQFAWIWDNPTKRGTDVTRNSIDAYPPLLHFHKLTSHFSFENKNIYCILGIKVISISSNFNI